MKKICTLLLSVLLVFLLVFGVSAAALGDVDADGSVTAADARLALRRAVDLETFARGSAQYTAADADRDGTVTAADARLILRAAVGLENLNPAEKLDPTEIFKLASRFTFEVRAENTDTVSTGSGFAISSDGKIVTNYHVVDEAQTISVTDYNGKTYPVVRVLAFDEELDLAVLEIAAETNPAELNYADYETGSSIYALGSSIGLTGTFSPGMISAKARRLEGERVIYIQHTAPISHGNSGGPLLDDCGRVLGVNVAYFEGGQNLNLAIPVRYLDELDFGNPMTVAQLAARFDAPGFEDEDVYQTLVDNKVFSITSKSVSYVSDDEICIRFDLVNKANQPLAFYLMDFAVNGMMISDVSYRTKDNLVGEKQTRIVTVTLTDYSMPTDFVFTPLGDCRFYYSVWAWDPVADMPMQEIKGGEASFLKRKGMRYDPHFDFSRYFISNSEFSMMCNYSKVEYWDDPDDTLGIYFFYHNESENEQLLEIEVTSVNGIPVTDENGKGQVSYYTVYADCCAVPALYLFYDVSGLYDYDLLLNGINIRPSEIEYVIYTIRVYDYEGGNERSIYSRAWKTNVG